jgi:uncharacterized membrane protein
MKVRCKTEFDPPLKARVGARASQVRSLLLALSVAALACGGSGDLPLDQVDPNAAPANPTYDQVFALMHNNCANCHTGGGDGGGESGYVLSSRRTTLEDGGPDLTDCVQIVAFAGDILDQVESDLMPPGAIPRLTSAEKLLLRRWVENGAPAPCN